MNVKEYYKIVGAGEPPEDVVRIGDAMQFYNKHRDKLVKEAYLGHLVAESGIMYKLSKNGAGK